jgi:hypothetical protein
MYRKNSGNEKRRVRDLGPHPGGSPQPFASGGFAGGIFSEPLGVLGRAGDYLNEDEVDQVDEVFDQVEEGVRPEHLLRPDDQDALAVGRSILGVVRAVGGLARAVTATGRVAAGDVRQHGLRGAVVESLRRAADQLDPQPVPDEGLYAQEPMHWWEDPYTARAMHDPHDPHWNFRREYVQPQPPTPQRSAPKRSSMPNAKPWPDIERFRHGRGYTPASTVEQREIPSGQQQADDDEQEDEMLDERAPGDDRPDAPDEGDDVFAVTDDLDSKI